MIEVLHIALEAHHEGRGHHRRYEIDVGRDLFGLWTVAIHYGRAGAALRTLTLTFADRPAAARCVRERLARRGSAPRRIGCAYELRTLRACSELPVTDWVSLAAFL